MKAQNKDVREEKLEQKLRILAEMGDWQGVLRAMDEFDTNNERRHASHRADMDTTIADREYREGEQYRVADLLKLSRAEDWDEIIFSQRPEDLYQLVEEYPVSAALRELTPAQRRVLFENVVHGSPAKDIAEMMGCSVRNVTKHRKTALDKVRFLVTGRIESGT
mgnify:FL=1